MKDISVHLGNDAAGKPVLMDVSVLLKTRLLIQSNSGGGKSWLLRRLAEQLFGKVPVIIIDPEGEFATLREKFGYVLVGKGGDTPADIRSAALVAHKLLELRASAVCDLYEMKEADRHLWVKLFTDALLNAPKHLWKPLVVIVDEAHIFIPEKGCGESVASESVVALSTRGRKRQFCAVFATQSLASLRKTASRNLLNRMIGPTFEDIDLQRAAELLSVPKEERKAFNLEMRVAEAGKFYALGRAISKTRIMLTVGPVETSHEIQNSKYGSEPPPPPDRVKALLPKLADLPQIAEEKVRTEAELKKELAELRRELAAKPKVAALPVPTAPTIQRIEVPVMTNDDWDRLAEIEAPLAGHMETLGAIKSDVNAVVSQLIALRTGIVARLHNLTTVNAVQRAIVKPPERTKVVPAPKRVLPTIEVNGDLELNAAQVRMMGVLAQRQGKTTTRNQLAVMAGYSSKSKHVDNIISTLRKIGFIEGERKSLSATPTGLAHRDWPQLPTGLDLLAYWVKEGDLSAKSAEMLQAVADAYPATISRDELAERVGLSVTSKHVDNELSTLRTRELVFGERSALKASADFFD